MNDYLADAFGGNAVPVPAGSPCQPALGATDKQKQIHADQWFVDHVTTRAARQLCAGCDVKTACLTANLNDPFGVYGGTTPDERKRLRGEADAA